MYSKGKWADFDAISDMLCFDEVVTQNFQPDSSLTLTTNGHSGGGGEGSILWRRVLDQAQVWIYEGYI